MGRMMEQTNPQSDSLMQQVLRLVLIVILVVTALGVGFFFFDKVYQVTLAAENMPDFTLDDGNSPGVGYQPGEPLPTWQGTDRINILLIGIDQREYEDGPWRTDTMMVLTIDPVTMNAGVLSIPRDLWVPIWGYDTEGRINTAHYLGDLYDYPGGGPALAAETVQYNLGVPIDYYARVNFTAFEELVDMIGGIDICVPEEIVDATYPAENSPGYDPLYIPAGCQHFDGALALKYARTRHTAGGDFDRAQRQQEVLQAVFDKVTDLNMLPELLPQVPEMWETLQDSVVTNLTLDQIVALARLASEVPYEDIRFGVIDHNYTQFWTTPDGQQVLIPLRDRIRELRDYIFTNDISVSVTEGDPVEQLEAEGATVQVFNGTVTPGLAGSTADYLTQHNLNVTDVGNADRADYVESLVIVYTGKTFTADYIVNLLDLEPTAVVHGTDDGNAEYDITVILGLDYQLPEE